jgi:N-acetylmuramoyl-L-alanine amidase
VRLRMLASQSGSGPGVAMVRETAALVDSPLANSLRVVVGHFGPVAHIAHAVARRIGERHPLTADVESSASDQARAANAAHADVYIGVEPSPDAGCTVQYYEVPTFTSVGGRGLALRIAAELTARIPEISVHVQGLRHPVLRETRMPAVLCSLGPVQVISLKTSAISLALCDALESWQRDPSQDI